MTQEQLDFTNGLTLAIGRGMTRGGVVELIATRDLAVEAAAIERAAQACNESDGWDMHPKDYYKLVRALLTPPHKAALVAHDRELTARLVAESCSNPRAVKEMLREREDRMLKRFEELANGWIEGERHSPFGLDEHGTTIPLRDGNLCAGELQSLIASIRKECE